VAVAIEVSIFFLADFLGLCWLLRNSRFRLRTSRYTIRAEPRVGGDAPQASTP